MKNKKLNERMLNVMPEINLVGCSLRILLFLIMPIQFCSCSHTSDNISASYNQTEDKAEPSSNINFSNLPLMNMNDLNSSDSATHTKPLQENISEDSDEVFKKGRSDEDISTKRNMPLSLDPERAKEVINAYRRKNNRKPLKLNTALTKAAEDHSRDLSKWDRVSHFGSDGSNPTDRVKRTGYKPKTATENIGTGQTDFVDVFDGWIKSPGYDKNLLLSEAEDMGLALVQDPKTEFKTFWVLVLAAPE